MRYGLTFLLPAMLAIAVLPTNVSADARVGDVNHLTPDDIKSVYEPIHRAQESAPPLPYVVGTAYPSRQSGIVFPFGLGLDGSFRVPLIAVHGHGK